jgi:CubicO group peptidase (beta-lactamase class C family)
MRRKWLFATLGLCIACIFGALLYAPYLPRLIEEGYPSATWPAPGSFAAVKGAPDRAVFEAAAPIAPNARLRTLFGESEGRALLAARGSKLVMEHYAPGITRETRLNSYSMVKSLVGALVLKAVAEGRIDSLEVKLRTVLTELAGSSTGELALCRLLDMKSGIAFQPGRKKTAMGLDIKDLERSRLNLFGPMARLHMTGLAGIEPQLLARTASSTNLSDCGAGEFSYQNVNTALAGAVLERVYQRPLQELLSDKIWKPAGAIDATWRRYGEGLPVTPYCCLYARPIDWLCVAQYLMTNGRPTAPFLPPRLWEAFLGKDLSHTQLHNGVYADFAYHNILDRPGETLQGPFAYFFGSKGQTVYLMPEQDLVVVRFGGKIQLLHSTLYGVGRSIGMDGMHR